MCCRNTMFDDTDRNTDESHGHHRHHHHGHYPNDRPHQDARHRHQTHHSEEDEILYNHETPVTLSRASSSSLSSSTSSSSSFSSWYTETSMINPVAIHHAQHPQHSLSCSNIADMRRGFRDDDGSEPIVIATVKHGKKGSVCSELHGSSQKRENSVFSALDRGHSRSVEGLLQRNKSDGKGERSRAQHMEYGPLYKTSSLSRSLAFSEEDIVLGVSRGPKRAVSSSQLPGKGILKNKEPHTDIRKAKSMEVLSPRVSKEQDPLGQGGKQATQAEIERAKANFVQGKVQFSAFLDEITKQVISPSDLNILGVNKNKATGKTPLPAQTPGPVKPQLPPKKHRESPGEEREQHPKQTSRQERAAGSSSRKHSDCSNPEKLISYAAKNHHGSPPPRHYPCSPSHNTNHGSSRKDRRPSPTGSSVSGDRSARCGPPLTDGTSTSPEPCQPKQRHHRKQQSSASHSQHAQQLPQHQPQQGYPSPSVGPGLGSESSSTKSDSSRARDTASTATSHSSEQSGRHHSPHAGQQRRVSLLWWCFCNFFWESTIIWDKKWRDFRPQIMNLVVSFVQKYKNRACTLDSAPISSGGLRMFEGQGRLQLLAPAVWNLQYIYSEERALHNVMFTRRAPWRGLYHVISTIGASKNFWRMAWAQNVTHGCNKYTWERHPVFASVQHLALFNVVDQSGN